MPVYRFLIFFLFKIVGFFDDEFQREGQTNHWRVLRFWRKGRRKKTKFVFVDQLVLIDWFLLTKCVLLFFSYGWKTHSSFDWKCHLKCGILIIGGFIKNFIKPIITVGFIEEIFKFKRHFLKNKKITLKWWFTKSFAS